MEDIPVFRTSKRRRIEHPKAAPSSGRDSSATTGAGRNDDSSEDGGNSGITRLRRPTKPGKTGVMFSSTNSTRNETADQRALTVAAALDQPHNITGRFIGSTGQKVDVDQHMLAYVDSQIAKQRQQQPVSTSQRLPTRQPNRASSESDSSASETPLPDHVPAANPKSATTTAQTGTQHHHQLSEVSLPPRQPTPPPQPKRQRIRKPRLDRHGRPLPPRPRGPRRRPSEDIARDALVEAVLSQHRLEHYQEPPTQSGQGSTALGSGDQASKAATQQNHDEAFAAQFQQEFEDRMAERRRAKKEGPSGASGATAGDKEKASEPRLGGSRNARMKMAERKEREKAAAAGTGSGSGKG